MPVRVSGNVLAIRDKSILFKDEKTKQKVFLPKSKIYNWGVIGEQFVLEPFDFDVEMVEDDDPVWVDIPTWLAEREFLV